MIVMDSFIYIVKLHCDLEFYGTEENLGDIQGFKISRVT
jgi:hypothetical protein